MTEQVEHYLLMNKSIRSAASSLAAVLGSEKLIERKLLFDELYEYLDHNEYGLALDCLVWIIKEEKVKVSKQLVSQIMEIAQAMGLGKSIHSTLSAIEVLTIHEDKK